jgi:D-glycero-D-manno-heptose 1,7-bisphosphate phosphatase
MPARLVLVDRDGVINRDSDEYIKSVAEWHPLPGSLEAIAALTRAGFTVAVVTNQSGVGRGLFSEETLAEIHAEMQQRAVEAGGHIAAIFYCQHLPSDGCDCRKPRPGLLELAAKQFGVPLNDVAYIGDRQSDIDAAINAGARPVLVGDCLPRSVRKSVEYYADLQTAAKALIAETGAE